MHTRLLCDCVRQQLENSMSEMAFRIRGMELDIDRARNAIDQYLRDIEAAQNEIDIREQYIVELLAIIKKLEA